MRNVLSRSDCQNLKIALSREWLETNGRGGYAAATIIGTNTRATHGLLVVALDPPGSRHVLLAKMEERVLAAGHEAHLSTNLYPGTVYPHGFNIQEEFQLRPWPTFRYANADFTMEKCVFLVHGEDTVVIGYRCLRARGAVELRVRPLLAFRQAHAPAHRRDWINMSVETAAGAYSLQPDPRLPRLVFHTQPTAVDVKPDWYYRLSYPRDEEQGLPAEEDLFSPLEFAYRLSPGQVVYLVATTTTRSGLRGEKLAALERDRRLHYESESDATRRTLLEAADALLVTRADGTPAVLAGLPDYTERGRDTLIALPGLTLMTGREDVARRILLAYARQCQGGMIPHLFPDGGQPPRYNAVDTALWFVLTCWRYWKATGDAATLQTLLPTITNIIRSYREGTQHNIHATADGLLWAGPADEPLTWMDVKADGYVPTPRHGLAVEVNALWYNAQMLAAELEEKVASRVHEAVILRELATQTARSFVRTFWYKDGGWLYDVVQTDQADVSIRPNQIFAVSLPHSPLDHAQQEAVFNIVTQRLLTPYGLRTLDPQHERYCARYAGNQWQREGARHQGSVWPWLLGPYCDARVRLHGLDRTQRKEIGRLIQPLLDHLNEAALGTVSELFDGQPPHRPGGGLAHAVNVAELLRVYDTYWR